VYRQEFLDEKKAISDSFHFVLSDPALERTRARDLVTVYHAFGSGTGDEAWNSVCDLNKGSMINIIDVAITARAVGKALK
jgi:hypothetical protein